MSLSDKKQFVTLNGTPIPALIPMTELSKYFSEGRVELIKLRQRNPALSKRTKSFIPKFADSSRRILDLRPDMNGGATEYIFPTTSDSSSRNPSQQQQQQQNEPSAASASAAAAASASSSPDQHQHDDDENREIVPLDDDNLGDENLAASDKTDNNASSVKTDIFTEESEMLRPKNDINNANNKQQQQQQSSPSSSSSVASPKQLAVPPNSFAQTPNHLKQVVPEVPPNSFALTPAGERAVSPPAPANSFASPLEENLSINNNNNNTNNENANVSSSTTNPSAPTSFLGDLLKRTSNVKARHTSPTTTISTSSSHRSPAPFSSPELNAEIQQKQKSPPLQSTTTTTTTKPAAAGDPFQHFSFSGAAHQDDAHDHQQQKQQEDHDDSIEHKVRQAVAAGTDLGRQVVDKASNFLSEKFASSHSDSKQQQQQQQAVKPLSNDSLASGGLASDHPHTTTATAATSSGVPTPMRRVDTASPLKKSGRPDTKKEEQQNSEPTTTTNDLIDRVNNATNNLREVYVEAKFPGGTIVSRSKSPSPEPVFVSDVERRAKTLTYLRGLAKNENAMVAGLPQGTSVNNNEEEQEDQNKHHYSSQLPENFKKQYQKQLRRLSQPGISSSLPNDDDVVTSSSSSQRKQQRKQQQQKQQKQEEENFPEEEKDLVSDALSITPLVSPQVKTETSAPSSLRNVAYAASSSSSSVLVPPPVSQQRLSNASQEQEQGGQQTDDTILGSGIRNKNFDQQQHQQHHHQRPEPPTSHPRSSSTPPASSSFTTTTTRNVTNFRDPLHSEENTPEKPQQQQQQREQAQQAQKPVPPPLRRNIKPSNKQQQQNDENAKHDHSHDDSDDDDVSSTTSSSSSSSSRNSRRRHHHRRRRHSTEKSEGTDENDHHDKKNNENDENAKSASSPTKTKQWARERADALRLLLGGLAILIAITIACVERDTWMTCGLRTMTRALRGNAVAGVPALIDDNDILANQIGTHVYVAATAGVWKSCVTARINRTEEGKLLEHWEDNLRNALRTVREGPSRSEDAVILSRETRGDWYMPGSETILTAINFTDALPIFQVCNTDIRDHRRCQDAVAVNFTRFRVITILMLIAAGGLFFGILLDLNFIVFCKVKVHKSVMTMTLIFIWSMSLSVWVLYTDSSNIPSYSGSTHAECELETNMREVLASFAYATIYVAENATKYQAMLDVLNDTGRDTSSWNSTELLTLQQMQGNLSVVPPTVLENPVMYFDDCKVGFSLFGLIAAWILFSLIVFFYLLSRVSAYISYHCPTTPGGADGKSSPTDLADAGWAVLNPMSWVYKAVSAATGFNFGPGAGASTSGASVNDISDSEYDDDYYDDDEDENNYNGETYRSSAGFGQKTYSGDDDDTDERYNKNKNSLGVSNQQQQQQQMPSSSTSSHGGGPNFSSDPSSQSASAVTSPVRASRQQHRKKTSGSNIIEKIVELGTSFANFSQQQQQEMQNIAAGDRSSNLASSGSFSGQQGFDSRPSSQQQQQHPGHRRKGSGSGSRRIQPEFSGVSDDMVGSSKNSLLDHFMNYGARLVLPKLVGVGAKQRKVEAEWLVKQLLPWVPPSLVPPLVDRLVDILKDAAMERYYLGQAEEQREQEALETAMASRRANENNNNDNEQKTQTLG